MLDTFFSSNVWLVPIFWHVLDELHRQSLKVWRFDEGICFRTKKYQKNPLWPQSPPPPRLTNQRLATKWDFLHQGYQRYPWRSQTLLRTGGVFGRYQWIRLIWVWAETFWSQQMERDRLDCTVFRCQQVDRRHCEPRLFNSSNNNNNKPTEWWGQATRALSLYSLKKRRIWNCICHWTTSNNDHFNGVFVVGALFPTWLVASHGMRRSGALFGVRLRQSNELRMEQRL